MAPRQRFTTELSSDVVDSPVDSPTLMPSSSTTSSSSSSSSSDNNKNDSNNNRKSIIKKSTSTSSLSSSSTSSNAPTEADIARDYHDYFNLVALLFIIGTTLLNYDMDKILKLEGMDSSWTGNYFWENWVVTFVYFIVDLVWVATIPICVKSPQVIIKHHIVAALYLLAPIYFPDYRWFMGSVLSVEVNTWFLILRRVVYKTDLHIPNIITELVSILFYITWILIRCVVYPAVLITFCTMAKEIIDDTGTIFHIPMIFIPVHFSLCVLNLKWTYDLFKPNFVQWFGPKHNNQNQQPIKIQKGL